MSQGSDNTESAGEESPTDSSRIRTTKRGVAAAVTTVSTVGCLGLFENDGAAGSSSESSSGEYTTVSKTTTFAAVTGSRTPYPSVPPIRLGAEGADLLVLFFDYGQQGSIDWWNETFSEVEPLIEDGSIRFSFANFPIPVSRWSVMVPCAVLEVRNQLDQNAAFEFHSSLVETGPDYSLSEIGDLAEAVGADRTEVEQAARDRLRRNQVFASRDLGTRNGVEEPPAGYTGDEIIPEPDAETIRETYTTDQE